MKPDFPAHKIYLHLGTLLSSPGKIFNCIVYKIIVYWLKMHWQLIEQSLTKSGIVFQIIFLSL